MIAGGLGALSEPFSLTGGGVIGQALVAGLAFALFPREPHMPRRRGLLFGGGLGLALFLLWLVLVGLPNGRPTTLPDADRGMWWLGVINTVLVAPLFEEKIVRHLLLRGFSGVIGGRLAIVAISAIFGIAHGRFFLYAFLLSVVLSGMAMYRDMDTWQRGAAHGLVNLGIWCWAVPGFLGHLL